MFGCLCCFSPNLNPPKWSQVSKFLIPNGLYFTLAVSPEPLGVEEAIHRNSFFYRCPLKSQYVVRKPLPAHSCHALLLSLSSPLMPQTSQDSLELDMYDVYLLINLCSKNGMRESCLGSAGSERVHDNRNANNHATQRRPKDVPGSS